MKILCATKEQVLDRIQCIKSKAVELQQILINIKIQRAVDCCFGGILTDEEEVILTDEYECILPDPES